MRLSKSPASSAVSERGPHDIGKSIWLTKTNVCLARWDKPARSIWPICIHSAGPKNAARHFLVHKFRMIAILAAAIITCQPTHPGTTRPDDWSYRTIEGRQCWYKGRPMMPKHRLRWPREDSERPLQDPKGWSHQE